MDATSQAVREIADGTDTQNADVTQVVMQEDELGEKFLQLQKKASFFWQTRRIQLFPGKTE